MAAGAGPRLGTRFLRTNGEKDLKNNKKRQNNLTFTFALAGLFVSALMHSEFCRVLFGGFFERGGAHPSSDSAVPRLWFLVC